MFCKNCGNEINNKAVVCVHCGVAVGGMVKKNIPAVPDAPSAGYAVLCFFFPMVGLILYLVWMGTYPLRANSCGKGALIGTLVSVISVIVSVLIISIFFTAVLGSIFQVIR